MKMKNRSHRYDINRPKPRYSTYKKSFKMLLLICIKQHIIAIFKALFMKKLSNIDAESNKSVIYIKKRVFVCPCLEIGSFRSLFYFY